MAYARVTVHYRDKSSTVIEVGHAAACHPDLLDELVARCRALYVETIGEEPAEVETEDGA